MLEKRYGVYLQTEVMVAMRDGVQMAADIYYPAVDGQRAPL